MPSAEDHKFFQDLGFKGRMGFGQRPALLIIDMQKGFTNPQTPLGSNLDSQISATIPLLDAAHRRNIPVYFSVCSYDHPELKDAGVWINKIKGLDILRAGTENVNVDERLDVRPGDTILKKRYASCFFGTDLTSRLSADQVDTLVMTGCTTSGCVRATAVDSCQYGFKPIVVREAVGDRSPEAHEQSLFDMDAKYADVLSVDDVVRYFDTL
jgi:nicotinamidase-related amidase